MLKRFINLVNRKRGPIEPRVIERADHNISRRNISRPAIRVMQELNKAGYQSYLVGGGVRDLLLGGHPKDFDVATDATPEQVKKVFRNARIIGRRFKIVHVRFGREIIEVTTFRGHHEDSNKANQSQQSDSGMLLRDNVYGDIESDALRRDFTINALYYTVEDFSVLDYTKGVKDIEKGQIRMIGDPLVRYQEDPVRLLRATRFAAKLNFDIEKKTATPIKPNAKLLDNIPAARLFDETLKLFMSGHAERSLELLIEYDLFQRLFPATAEHLTHNAEAKTLLIQAMKNTDQRIQNDLRVTPAYLFAALLWPDYQAHQAKFQSEGHAPFQAFQMASQAAITRQIQRTSIPKRFTQGMKDIWELQLRLPNRGGQRAFRLLENPRLRAGYDFLLMREQAGEDLQGLGQWWTQFLDSDDEQRGELAANVSNSGPKKRRRRPKKRKAPTSAE